MPLIVKDYVWRQTKEYLTITLPLKGVAQSKVDVYTSDDYVKASYPPFLFEVFLFAKIFESESKCILSDDTITFELKKEDPAEWENLTADISKIEMLEKRKELVERNLKKAEEDEKRKKETLQNLKRLSVQQQIDRDTNNRHIIDERRNFERKKAMDDLEDWKMNQQVPETAEKEETIKAIFLESEFHDAVNTQETVISKTTSKCESTLEDGADKCLDNKIKSTLDPVIESKPTDNKPLEVFPMPLPRPRGNITVQFTHREFPTPSRESQTPQEEEWLKKQVAARRATGFIPEDLRPEECNPSWLKDRGDAFYKAGNYLGAVSAYTHAIKMGSKMATLYSNRAAAHLGLGNLHKALDDCSKALELMTPEVPANSEMRAKCHARRGAVLCRLGLPEAGLADLQKAKKLQPNDLQLEDDIEKAKVLIKTQPDREEKQFEGLQIIPQP